MILHNERISFAHISLKALMTMHHIECYIKQLPLLHDCISAHCQICSFYQCVYLQCTFISIIYIKNDSMPIVKKV